MKPSLLRVLLSELVLVTFLSTTLVPIHIWADEGVTPMDPSSQSEETLPPIFESTPSIENSSSTNDTTQLEDITSSTEQTDTASGITLSGSTENQAGSGETLTPIIVPEGGSTHSGTLESTGSIFDIPVIIPETPKIITEVVQEKGVLREKSRPENEVLVQFNESNINVDSYIGQYQIDQIESTQDIVMTDTIPEQNIAVMTVQEENPDNISASGVIDESVIDAKITELKKDPRVKYAQKNFIYQINSLQKSPRAIQPTTFSGRSLPNDTANFQNLWALDNKGQYVEGYKYTGENISVSGEVDADIDYPEAMAYASGKLNTKVVVAILDTGIEAHTDLIGNLWDGSNCKSDTGAILGGCLHGYDFVDEDKDPTDSNHEEHGSHVAGTIGAITNNGTGTVGVSPNVSLMAVRICGEECPTSAIIRGINFAKYNGAKVINMSLGGSMHTSTVSDFDFLTYHAIESFSGLVIASAGNAGRNNDIYKVFPAGLGSDILVSGEAIIDRELVSTGTVIIPGLENIISVAASDQNDQLADFSNYGVNTVDIAAPGVNIYSTVMMAGSDITDIVSGENGWTKQAGVSSEFWSTRTIGAISGEYVNLTGALWADSNTPYAPDTSAYIQKDFQNITPGIYDVHMQAWCDSYKDDGGGYLDTMMSSTGGIFESVKIVDKASLYLETPVWSIFWIDGRQGVYADILITSTYLDQNGGMRIKWKSEGPNSRGLAGCIVKSISLASQTSSYEFMDGTSMAAPHVSGAAALAWSYKPDATIDEIKTAILTSGDWKGSFVGKVTSQSRLNISNMLQALDAPTVVSQKITVSGESNAIINVETSQNIADVFMDYATSSGALNSISGSGVYGLFLNQLSNTTYRSNLSELIPNTTYYYRIYACSIVTCNIDNEHIYSFTTPSLVGNTLSGSLSTSGSVYLSGSTASGSVFSGSTASGHIILTHPDTSVTVDIPTQNLIISASGTWDGILNAPRTVTGATNISVNSVNIPVSVIYKVGSDTSSLTLSGQVATIRIASALPNGTVVAVYRADSESSPYTQITSCTIINSLCIFTTDHFSVFALGSGSSGSSTSGGSTPSSPSSSVSNTGPGGGSGGIPVFVNPVGTALQALLPVNSSGSISLATQISIKFNIFKRQETIDWIQKNKEIYSSAEIFEKLDDQIQLQETRLGRLIAYDITLSAVGTLVKKSSGITKTTFTKVQKDLGTARKIYIKALFGY